MTKFDNDISVFVAFDEHLYEVQSRYNKDYCAKVNAVLSMLKDEVEDLTEQDIIDFLSQPAALIARLEAADREEFNSFVSGLPKSVAAGMEFKFTKGETIKSLHKQLPQPSTFFLKINCCKIEDKKCVFDETELRKRCTIDGSPLLLSLWTKAQELTATLNKMQATLKEINPSTSMAMIEDPHTLTVGLILTNGREYVADIDRLRRLTGTLV